MSDRFGSALDRLEAKINAKLERYRQSRQNVMAKEERDARARLRLLEYSRARSAEARRLLEIEEAWELSDSEFARTIFQPGAKGWKERGDIRQRGRFFFASPDIEDPIEQTNRYFSQFSLHILRVRFDLPRFTTVIRPAYTHVYYNEVGEVLYMEKKKKVVEKIEIPPVVAAPTFPEMYPRAPFTSLSIEEKDNRCLVFLELYEAHGFVLPACRAVGLVYSDIMYHISQSAQLKTKAQLAEKGVGMMYQDHANALAMGGDGSMLRFLMKRQDEAESATTGDTTTVRRKSSMEATLDIFARAEAKLETRDQKLLPAQIIDVVALNVPSTEQVTEVENA